MNREMSHTRFGIVVKTVVAPLARASAGTHWITGIKIGLATLIVCLPLAAAILAQAPPVLNQPYRCANGHTFTIEKCVPYRADQWCNWHENDERGQEVMNVNSTWTSMGGRLAGCTVPSAAKTSTSSGGGSVAPSGPLNPPYLKPFPTSVQLITQLKGTSAADTTNLQLGALRELQQIIQDLAGSRWYQRQMTPDEMRYLTDYAAAYEKMAHPLNYPLDGYFGRPQLAQKLADTFGMDPVFQQWFAINKQAAAYSAKASPSGSGGAGNSGASGSGAAGRVTTPVAPTNDPGKLAIARCLELGGSGLECLGGGVSKDWWGPLDEAMSKPQNPGLRVLGQFNSTSKVGINFTNDAASIGGCGALLPVDAGYQVQKVGNQFAVKLNTSPQPTLVALSVDGKLAAPASVTLDGKIIIGYRTETQYLKDMNTNQIVPGSQHDVQIPILGPKTDHCSMGAMTAGVATPDDGFLASLSGVFDAIGAMAGDADATKAVAKKTMVAGLRIIGTYLGPGGLRLEFKSSAVVVDCQQAHVAVPYEVSAPAAGVGITTKDAAATLSLLMQSNTSLAGTGSITVKGRLLAGFDANNNAVFNPTSATCAVGTLTLK